MQVLRILISFSLVTFSVAVFAAEEVEKVSYREMIRLNNVNVTKITTGMTRDEVVQIMGNIRSKVRNGPINNPWKVEFHGDMEILHYITAEHPPFMRIMVKQATPIVLKNGKVVGVGRGVLNEIKAAASPAPVKPESSTGKSLEERLNTLKRLYDAGTIDKEDYETQKTRILESI